ncbi:MAG: tyrosine-type recombinase/integrase [Planctomycetota bacterium]|nr:tyrosine-type recombinase/integrase [Planctomycetota bacterium]
MEEIVDGYFLAAQAKGIALKTVWKYRADLNKLKEFCGEIQLGLARGYSETHLYRYRQWLEKKGYSAKTIQGALVVAKQVFKWAWRQGILRDYRLAAATFPRAKAGPQPCFTSEQADQLIQVAVGEEKAAIALMAYAGLRIGEVEQLQWNDIHCRDGQPAMIHVRRGGSNGATKDKEDRFVPVHPKVADLLGRVRDDKAPIFRDITERRLLQRLKELCGDCGFENPTQYKLHSFRHHFASLCANSHVPHRKALAWLGHSSSEMLDLYYHLHDDDSWQAMQALAGDAAGGESAPENPAEAEDEDESDEGNSRATGGSTIEKTLQAPEVRELVGALGGLTERVRAPRPALSSGI